MQREIFSLEIFSKTERALYNIKKFKDKSYMRPWNENVRNLNQIYLNTNIYISFLIIITRELLYCD